jgi:hypothetical protein
MTPPKPGDRIKLINMPDDPYPIEPSTTGTVTSVRPVGSGSSIWYQVSVAWDTGRNLMLAVPPDEYEVLSGGAR